MATEERLESLESRSVRLSVGTMATLASLLVTVVWGYSSLTGKVEALTDMVNELRGDFKAMQGNRYTSSDAVRDMSRIQEALTTMEKRIGSIERCEVYSRCRAMEQGGGIK